MCKHIPKIDYLKGSFGSCIPKNIFENGTAICKKCHAEIVCQKKPKRFVISLIQVFSLVVLFKEMLTFVGDLAFRSATIFYTKHISSSLFANQMFFEIYNQTIDVKLTLLKILFLALFAIPVYYVCSLLCTVACDFYLRSLGWTHQTD